MAGEEESVTLATIGSVVRGCRACPRLVAFREQVAAEKVRRHAGETYWGRPIPAFGDPGARVLVVGLAPAAHGANRTGRPFTGDGGGGSSEWVARGLHAVGLANQPTSRAADDGLVLTGALLTGAVRCAPPGNRPSRDEIDRCRPFLEAELSALQELRVVVALGRAAFEAVLAAWPGAGGRAVGRPRPVFGHGLEVPLPGGAGRAGVSLLASYHPSRQNTQTGRLTWVMWRRALERAAALAERPGGPRREVSRRRERAGAPSSG